MALFKRGKTYWYEFVFDGTRHRRSTQSRNKTDARRIEAAERERLARVKAGLEPPEPPAQPDKVEKPPAPTLRAFAPEFRSHIELRCAEKPETIRFL